MNIYLIIGILNIVLSLSSILILVKVGIYSETLDTVETILKGNVLQIVSLFSLVVNSVLAYILLIKKAHKKSIFLYIFITLLPSLWFLIVLIGYFISTNLFFLLAGIFITIAVYYLLHKISFPIAIVVSIMTIIIFILAIYSGFEEDYCWNKGAEADMFGSEFVIASKKDEEVLKTFGVKEGQEIGIGFRTHMLCHNSFNFAEAMKDLYW